ncbi:hypothetical protein Tco_1210999, partial [Tanacetum coccineum]
DDQEPSAGTDQGSKRRRAGKEPESSSAPKETTSKSKGKSTEGSKSRHQSAPTEEPIHTEDDFKEPTHQEFKTGVNDNQPEDEIHPHPDWFQKPTRLPSPDHDWNKALPTNHGPVQLWLSNLARKEDPRESFDKLMDTPLDFSAFVMNRLKVDTLTPELLAGPTFELMKGTCKSLFELEYFFEEVYKATTEQLDWTNPDGHQYPLDLRKPLPLISNTRGRQVIPFDHFINNDLAYLSGGVLSRNYDKYDLWGISHWDENDNNSMDMRLIGNLQKMSIQEEESLRDDDKLYSFKEGDLKRLRVQDIEDMLILLVQGKLSNLKIEERLAFSVALRMFTRSIVIQRRVEDFQLAYSSPRGFIYQNKDKKNRLMRLDELHKFSDGTLDDVRTALDDRLKGIRMEYLPKTIWRKSDREHATAMIQAIDKRLKSRRIMRSLEKFVGGRPYEDVPVTTIAEPPLLSAITLLPTPFITHLQQTLVPSPATVPSSSLQDLPNFGSLFGFDHRLKTLETDFFEFKQTNQFAEADSSIPSIVDAYLANKMHKAVKTAI